MQQHVKFMGISNTLDAPNVLGVLKEAIRE